MDHITASPVARISYPSGISVELFGAVDLHIKNQSKSINSDEFGEGISRRFGRTENTG
ncbi:hypothetical protein [Algoriphagus aquimarinus]|uniref:hypothetical protein n=1 Tax=Algoriphagus aquimarinus TaxID=237018 RepID=UPI0030D76C82